MSETEKESLRILAIDTSGPVAAVALAERTADGREQLIAGFRLQYKTTHSQTLMPMMEQIRTLTALDLSTVDAVAVAAGPGSFTGLRIGASTAKGLCLALEKPLIAVPTLEALALQGASARGLVCPMMDARRQQVYTALYRMTCGPVSGAEDAEADQGTGKERRLQSEECIPPCAIDVREIVKEINAAFRETDVPVTLLGDGVPPYLPQIRAAMEVPYQILPFYRDRQSAEAVAFAAFRRWDQGKRENADDFVPEYLRPSQAERVRKEAESGGTTAL